MCQTRSGVAVKISESEIRIYMSDDDSHNTIREEHHLRDDDGPLASRQTPVEFVPATDLLDLDTWEFVFDDSHPDWWTDSMTEQAVRQFKADLSPKIEHLKDTGVWDGCLVLHGKKLPAGTELIVTIGGDARFPRLTDASGLEALVTIGGDADFSRLTDASGLEALATIGGYAYFSNLTDASGLKSLTTIGRYADFSSLTDAVRKALFVRIGQ